MENKSFARARAVLTKELYRLIGEYFGDQVLQQQVEKDEVAKFLTQMMGTPESALPENIQEIVEALHVLATHKGADHAEG